jgi:hypothetical protein
MKMTKEVFEARLLQIQLERDALNAEIMSMAGEDADRTRQGYALAWGPAMFSEVAESLRGLQGDIKKLMDEYQEGVVSPEEKYALPRLYTAEEMHRAYDFGRESYMLNEASGASDAACEKFIKSLEGAGK